MDDRGTAGNDDERSTGIVDLDSRMHAAYAEATTPRPRRPRRNNGNDACKGCDGIVTRHHGGYLRACGGTDPPAKEDCTAHPLQQTVHTSARHGMQDKNTGIGTPLGTTPKNVAIQTITCDTNAPHHAHLSNQGTTERMLQQTHMHMPKNMPRKCKTKEEDKD